MDKFTQIIVFYIVLSVTFATIGHVMSKKKDKKNNMLLGFTIGVVTSYALWVNFGRKMVKNKKY